MENLNKDLVKLLDQISTDLSREDAKIYATASCFSEDVERLMEKNDYQEIRNRLIVYQSIVDGVIDRLIRTSWRISDAQMDVEKLLSK